MFRPCETTIQFKNIYNGNNINGAWPPVFNAFFITCDLYYF